MKVYDTPLKIFLMLSITKYLSVAIVKHDTTYDHSKFQLLNSSIDLYQTLFPHTKRVAIFVSTNSDIFYSFGHEISRVKYMSVLITNGNSFEQSLVRKKNVHGEDELTILYVGKRHLSSQNMTTDYKFLRNSRINILIIFISVQCSIDTNIQKMFQSLWALRILKVAVFCVEIIENILGDYKDTFNSHNCILVSSYNPFLNVIYHENVNLKDLSKARHVLNEAYSPTKTNNLYGYTLLKANVEVDAMPAFLYYKADNEKSYVCEGYFKKVFESLEEYMNFSTKSVVTHGWFKYGYEVENGTWEDLMGSLARKDVDIAETPLAYIPVRLSIIEYSDYVMSTTLSSMVPRGKKIPPVVALLRIYKPEVWYSIIVAFFVVCVALRILYMACVTGTIRLGVSEIFLNMFAALLQMSITQPKNNVWRIMFTGWIYFSLVISSLYQGGIVGILTVPKYYPAVNTLEELVKSGLEIRGSKFLEKLFNDETDPVVYSLYKRLQVFPGIEEPVKYLVKYGTTAVVNNFECLVYEGKKAHECLDCVSPFHIMEEKFYNKLRFIPFPKGSVFLPRFNVLIKRMKYCGLISKWLSDIYWQLETHSICKTPCNTEVVAITLQNVHAVFYILIGGCTVAFMVFLIENLRKLVHLKYTN